MGKWEALELCDLLTNPANEFFAEWQRYFNSTSSKQACTDRDEGSHRTKRALDAMWEALFQALGIDLSRARGVVEVLMGAATFSACFPGHAGGTPTVTVKQSLARVLCRHGIADAGIFLIDEYHTSKLCAYCGHVLTLIPSVHDYLLCLNRDCPHRGLVHRDGNAALNIYYLGLLELLSFPRPNAFTCTATPLEMGGSAWQNILTIAEALSAVATPAMTTATSRASISAFLLSLDQFAAQIPASRAMAYCRARVVLAGRRPAAIALRTTLLADEPEPHSTDLQPQLTAAQALLTAEPVAAQAVMAQAALLRADARAARRAAADGDGGGGGAAETEVLDDDDDDDGSADDDGAAEAGVLDESSDDESDDEFDRLRRVPAAGNGAT